MNLKKSLSKIFIPLFICMAVNCAIVFLCLHSSAEAKDSGALVLSIDDVTVAPKKSAAAAVEIVSNPGIMALELTPILPEQFSLNSIKVGEILPVADLEKQVVFLADNDVRKNGILLTINFTCADNVQPGSYPLEIEVRACGNYNGEHIPVRINVGTIKVVNSIDSDDYFLYEQEKNGKTDILANEEGTLLRNSNSRYARLYDASIGNMLTDGVIAAKHIIGETGKVVCLDHDVCLESEVNGKPVKNIRLSGVQNFVYGIGFFNLKSVTVDSFDLYYCEPSVRGKTVGEVRVDNSISVIVYSDNGSSYKTVYDSKSAGYEKQPTEEVKVYSPNGTDLKGYYKVAHIQLDEPVEGVTCIIIASNDNTPFFSKSGNISEISAYSPLSDTDKPTVTPAHNSSEATEPVEPELPPNSSGPDITSNPKASEPPENVEKPGGSPNAEMSNDSSGTESSKITDLPEDNESETIKKENEEKSYGKTDDANGSRKGYLAAACVAIVCLAALGTGTVVFLKKRNK